MKNINNEINKLINLMINKINKLINYMKKSII